MQKNACVIDAYSHGSYHEVINQGYLMMISELYEHVTYIADKSSCQNLKLLMEASDFDYSNVSICEKKISRPKLKWAGLNYLLWLIKVSLLNYIYYIRSPKNTDVFYNNNLFFAIGLIRFFSFFNKNKVFDMCHNEMELINPSKRNTRVMKILGIYFDFVFKKSVLSPKMKFLLLSPQMADYFKTFIRRDNYDRIDWIDHCYVRPKNEIICPKEKIPFSGVKIGIPGAVTEDRGLPQLRNVLAQLNNEKVKIFAISYIKGDVESRFLEYVNKSSTLLPFDEYNGYVQQMDALMLLYNRESYKLTASGAILEAIWNLKPIFAIKNAYFEYLFNKFGNIGELFDDVENLSNYLNNLNDAFFARYRDSLVRARESLLPSGVKTQLHKAICS